MLWIVNKYDLRLKSCCTTSDQSTLVVSNLRTIFKFYRECRVTDTTADVSTHMTQFPSAEEKSNLGVVAGSPTRTGLLACQAQLDLCIFLKELICSLVVFFLLQGSDSLFFRLVLPRAPLINVRLNITIRSFRSQYLTPT